MKLQRVIAIFQIILKWFKRILYFLGFIFLCLWVLSFTDIPYHAYHSLGTSAGKLKSEPTLIVILGGSGMPSPDGFMRCYFAAIAAKKFPNSNIIIALPSNQNDSLKQLNLMKKELIIHGIDSSRIFFEPYGYNTHSQANNIANLYSSEKSNHSLLVVTSPEHMYRAVKTFRAVGFKDVGGEPTFEVPSDEEKITNRNRSQIKSISLRYNIWSYLHYELIVLREYTAIAYYWLMGWI